MTQVPQPLSEVNAQVTVRSSAEPILKPDEQRSLYRNDQHPAALNERNHPIEASKTRNRCASQTQRQAVLGGGLGDGEPEAAREFGATTSRLLVVPH